MIFPANHAEDAHRAGWSHPAILNMYDWCKRRGHRVTGTLGTAVVVDDRYAVYLGRPLTEVELEIARASADPEAVLSPVVVYCDGSGTVETKPAGIGVVVLRARQPPRLIHEGCGHGTNNHAEVSAILRGLQAVPDLWQPVVVRSDSAWALGASNPANRWVVNKNVELVARARAELDARAGRVELEHVRGHRPLSSKEGLWNNVADVLARAGRLGEEPRFPRALAKLLAETFAPPDMTNGYPEPLPVVGLSKQIERVA